MPKQSGKGGITRPTLWYETYVNLNDVLVDVCHALNLALLLHNLPQYEAATKEINAIRAIFKSVEDHNLQSEYPCEHLGKRISELEKQKGGRKWYQQIPQHPANKRHKKASTSPDKVSPSSPHPSQPAGLLADRVNPYSSSAGLYALAGGSGSGSGLYGLVGGTGAAPVPSAPYMGPGSSGLYGLAGGLGALHDPIYDRHLGSGLRGAHLSYGGGNRSPPRSHLHAEALSSTLYEKPLGYGGYPTVGLPPPFRPPFFP